MMSIRTLALAIAATAVFAPAAFAQDASDTASDKHFSVVGGYSLSEPTRNPEIGGQLTSVKGQGAPTLAATYHINDNFAIEAWGSDKVSHEVKINGNKTANLDAQPYSLSGQYHFGAADNIVRPYVGVGYYESNFSGESTASTGALAGQRLGVETVKGAVGTVGVDVNITPTWFARADARYFDGESDAKVNGVKAGNVDLNPVVVGVGVGARF